MRSGDCREIIVGKLDQPTISKISHKMKRKVKYTFSDFNRILRIKTRKSWLQSLTQTISLRSAPEVPARSSLSLSPRSLPLRLPAGAGQSSGRPGRLEDDPAGPAGPLLRLASLQLRAPSLLWLGGHLASLLLPVLLPRHHHHHPLHLPPGLPHQHRQHRQYQPPHQDLL